MKKLLFILAMVIVGAQARAETITLPQPLVITSAVTQVELIDVTPPLTTNDPWRIRCSVVVPLPSWANIDAAGVQLRTTAMSELIISITRSEIEAALGEPYAGITMGQANTKITTAAFGKWLAVVQQAAADAP